MNALLIAQNRGLATEFKQALGGELPAISLAEVQEFPTSAQLEALLVHYQPDLVFLDATADAGSAAERVRLLRALRPECQPVILHAGRDPALVVNLLRAGAADLFTVPFAATEIKLSLTRLHRMLRPAPHPGREKRGQVCAFVSAKPGAGASTLASQSAFALKTITGESVLLADLNLRAGTSHCGLDPRARYSSLADVAESSACLADLRNWIGWTVRVHGVDFLPSPAEPVMRRVPRDRMEEILEGLRRLYDWVVLDLPSLADETATTALALTDEVDVVTTTELPSLHLAHRLRRLLEIAGVEPGLLRLVVNRVRPSDILTAASLEKSLRMPVAAFLPNDYQALHSGGSSGQPLVGDGKLAVGLRKLAARLCQRRSSTCSVTALSPLRGAMQAAAAR